LSILDKPIDHDPLDIEIIARAPEHIVTADLKKREARRCDERAQNAAVSAEYGPALPFFARCKRSVG
jgi:hypothetical protein